MVSKMEFEPEFCMHALLCMINDEFMCRRPW